MLDTYEMLEARQLMAAEQYPQALAELDKTPAEERDAEWYFLRSQIEEKSACYYNSVTSLKKAVELDPENQAYKTALKAMQKSLKKDTASKSGKVAGMAAGVGSVCDSFKNRDFKGCGEICCEGCGEGCCECIGEAACDGCDCDCDCG